MLGPEKDLLRSDETQQLLAECYASTKKFAQVFMPDRFWRPFSPLHDKIFAVMDDDSIKKAAISAPRGVGKTTLLDIVLPAKKILFRDTFYTVIVGASNTNAEQQTENLKDELTSNPHIQKIFGDIKSGTFAREQWITESGIMVMPRGAGQKIRGLLHRSKRPDLFIIDDLENDENVQSKEQRTKLRDWFHAAVVNSVDKGLPYRILVIGTPLHHDSLLSNLLDDPDWFSVKLSICDENFKSYYPELMSDAIIQRELISHRERGTLDVFYREYMGLPIATESHGFTQNMFVQYNEVELKEKIRKHEAKIENFILVDPAKTVTATSDYSAILCCGVDLRSGLLYFRDMLVARLHPDELYEETFKMAANWGAKAVGLEVTSLNEFITYPFKTAMLKRGSWLEVVELKARGNEKKMERIHALVPFYRKGLILHNSNGCCNTLETQLLCAPKGKYDDAADCAAYVIEMLDLCDQFFEMQTAGQDAELFKQMFEEDKAEPLMSGWRCAP